MQTKFSKAELQVNMEEVHAEVQRTLKPNEHGYNVITESEYTLIVGKANPNIIAVMEDLANYIMGKHPRAVYVNGTSPADLQTYNAGDKVYFTIELDGEQMLDQLLDSEVRCDVFTANTYTNFVFQQYQPYCEGYTDGYIHGLGMGNACSEVMEGYCCEPLTDCIEGLKTESELKSGEMDVLRAQLKIQELAHEFGQLLQK